MIRVVMFDLGLTLIDADNRPFPHVKDALDAISTFRAENGNPLRRCLVSDFTMASPPATSAKVSALFKQYLAILDPTGLRPFFEPVSKRITLSTHAGVLKPDRKIFETALSRLGAGVQLQECLFITENAAHIKAARETLEMQTLRFRSAGSNQFDFEDWAQAPALIAGLVAPNQPANTHAAIKAQLAAQGVDLLKLENTAAPNEMKITAQAWTPVSLPGHEDLKDLLIAIPVGGKMKRGSKGEVTSTKLEKPSTEQISEATDFVRSLAAHGQIESPGGKGGSGATHEIKTDEKGKRRLVRKRFSAV